MTDVELEMAEDLHDKLLHEAEARDITVEDLIVEILQEFLIE